MQQYGFSVFISLLSIIAFISFTVLGVYVYRRCATARLHGNDFRRLGREAEDLCKMTLRVRRDFDIVRRGWNGGGSDGLVEELKLLDQAEDRDNAIQIALCSWQDIMESKRQIDIEAQKRMSLGSKVERKRRLTHGKWLAEVMREKVIEGIEKRRELTYPLHKLHVELHERCKNEDGVRGGGKDRCEEGDVTEVIVHKRDISSEEYDLGSDTRSGQVVYTSILEQELHTTLPTRAFEVAGGSP